MLLPWIATGGREDDRRGWGRSRGVRGRLSNLPQACNDKHLPLLEAVMGREALPGRFDAEPVRSAGAAGISGEHQPWRELEIARTP